MNNGVRKLMTISAHWRPGIVLLLGLAALPFSVHGGELLTQPWRFDAGPAGSVPETRFLVLTPETGYTAASGYGWLAAPEAAVHHDARSRSRDTFTIDGVTGKQYAFKADLPGGKWGLTLWIEAGMEDSSTLIISTNGKNIAPAWQDFNPPAEGRTSPQIIYRVHHQIVDVGESGLELAFKSDADEITLLGLTLLPMGAPENELDQSIFEELQRLGTYGGHLALENILADGGGPDALRDLQIKLERRLAADETDGFAAYWHEQLSVLIQAEDMLRLLGWEWANTEYGLGLFDRYFQIVMYLDGLLGYPEAGDSPLYERALFQRARMLYWLNLERGGDQEEAAALRDVGAIHNLYPNDELLRMYHGDEVVTAGPCEALTPNPNAPEWSQVQQQILCRLKQEINWWVDERQAENGEFGGKIGDDVELLRVWPALAASGHKNTLTGWSKLADAAWNSRKVHEGYSKRPLDVEHASEYIADTAPELALFLDEQVYVDRLRYSVDYFLDFWTVRTGNDERYFKSAWFSSTEIDAEPPRDRDLEMNTRATKAVRYSAFLTGDEQVINGLEEWSLGWLRVARSRDKGKPKGIMPASVRASDGAINGDEPTWYQANMFWDYFEWQHNAGTMLLDQLLFTSILTGNQALLEPITESLKLVSEFEARHGLMQAHEFAPGSTEWAAAILRDELKFWDVIEQWRMVTNDDTYDDLILLRGTPYSRFRLTGDEQALVAGMTSLLRTTRTNRPLRTTEVLHTDRVYLPGADHVKAMLTGSGMSEGSSPYYLVTWENTGDGFTALVRSGDAQTLEVDIFDHGRKSSKLSARLWRLLPGKYTLTVTRDGKRPKTRTVRVKGRGDRVAMTIPAGERVHISLKAK